ncbi:plasminogen-binding N-terminal domain-containing protein [Sulfurimonas sp. C5]|uniref:plasminogen-binding N-terminal domain-containing protein n=1 Tax=Sulfurimonas sp. C5 TaxID=3036947 RepID=UPI0024539639|nr:plasminogen-binding N-terminal domain-containing protein [Sulfurimonas sp. C5]MDH4944636.1 plasminogen-binding N-terminal domain-containing protein [Sulfurimonas sp. C5]
MRYIFLLFLAQLSLFASPVSSKIIELDTENETAKINIDKIDVGMSGYVVHHISPEHSSILKSCVVESFDVNTHTAMIKMKEFELLQNNALPSGKWKVTVGDSVELATSYSRSLLIAPNEEVYYQVSKSVETQWIHPDIFATLLSINGHPTPLKEDFGAFSSSTATGLVFIYLEKKLYTVDMKSFKILAISDTPLIQDSVKLPFYSRMEKIDASWFGEGSSEMESYEPHYYELLVENNKHNKVLYNIVKNSKNEEVSSLVDQFEIGE